MTNPKKRKSLGHINNLVGISDVNGPAHPPEHENRSFGRCPKCGSKATIESLRVSRDQGDTWIVQTIHRCWSMRRTRCVPTVSEHPCRPEIFLPAKLKGTQK